LNFDALHTELNICATRLLEIVEGSEPAGNVMQIRQWTAAQRTKFRETISPTIQIATSFLNQQNDERPTQFEFCW